MSMQYQTTAVLVTVTSKNLKTVYIKLPIRKGIDQFRFINRFILEFPINSANISYLLRSELI